MKNNLSASFNKELQDSGAESLLSPVFLRKKLIIYAVRTTIAIILYVIFWEYNWVRWSLWFYVPLNLFSLFVIFGSRFIIQRKLEQTRRKIEELEELDHLNPETYETNQ